MILDERLAEAKAIMLAHLPQKSPFRDALEQSQEDEFYDFLRLAGIGVGYINNIVANAIHTNLVLHESKQNRKARIDDAIARRKEVEKMSVIEKEVFRKTLSGGIDFKEELFYQAKELIFLIKKPENFEKLKGSMGVKYYIAQLRKHREIVTPRIHDVPAMILFNDLVYQAKEAIENAKNTAITVLKAGRRQARRKDK